MSQQAHFKLKIYRQYKADGVAVAIWLEYDKLRVPQPNRNFSS